MPKNSIPDRWLDYKPIGSQMNDSCFVAMKVPLKKEINVPEQDRFSCEDVLQTFDERQQDLGLIVDLTYTSRYYNPQFFISKGIDHCKILMPGHQIPSRHIVDTFKRKIQSFEKENMGKKKFVAVHCTHGVNRTGYLICRYLIEEKGMDPEEAISLFEQARGHTIERPIYLDNLRQLNASRCSPTKSSKSPPKQKVFRKTTQELPPQSHQHQRGRHNHRNSYFRSRRPYFHEMGQENPDSHGQYYQDWAWNQQQYTHQTPHYYNGSQYSYSPRERYDHHQPWSHPYDQYYDSSATREHRQSYRGRFHSYKFH